MFENLKRNLSPHRGDNISCDINFGDGVKVTANGYSESPTRVEFWNDLTGTLEYSVDLTPGCFGAPSKKYFIPWRIEVFFNGQKIGGTRLNLEGKTVHLFFDSTSLGDTLAWVPQVEKFRRERKCRVVLTTFHNYLFEGMYPEIIWNLPGSSLPNVDVFYNIGYFLGEERFNYIPVDPRTIPLGQVASEILGVPYEEERPNLPRVEGFYNPLEGKKYVCMASASTAGAKYWHNEEGWRRVISELKNMGYEVVNIQKEPNQWEGVVDLTGDKPLLERAEFLRGAEFFIGLPSGLSWLSWAVSTPVVMISGFSDDYAEFQMDCYRVSNKKVCNSCWNDPKHTFDKGDWWWCPQLKGTGRHFECTKTITPEMVMEKIHQLREEKKLN